MNPPYDQSSLSEPVSLRDGEELFRTLCVSVPVGIFLSDAQGNCTYINEACEEITGITRQSACGSGWYSAIHPDDREQVIEDWTQSLRAAHNFSSEFRFEHADGKIVWVQANAIARRGDRGEIAGFVATLTDITARKHAERFLELENQLLAEFARGMPLSDSLRRLVHFIEDQATGVVASVNLLDSDGVHLRHGAAPRLATAFNQALDGIAIGEGVGSCGTAAFRCEPVFVDDIETDPLWERYRELARPQRLRSCWSTPILDPKGKVLGTFALYRREPGGPTAHDRKLMDAATHLASLLLARHRDQQNLLIRERRFRTIFEQAAVGVAQLDSTSGTILRVNRRYCDILGIAADGLLGKTWMDLTHPNDLQADLDNMEQMRAGEIREFALEKRLHRPDGSYVWVNLTVSPMWRIGEAPTTHIAIVEDITDRKHVEEQLRLTKFSVESCSTSVFWVRRDASFLYVNDAAANRFGYTRDELLMMKVHDIDPAYTAEIWPGYWEAMQREQTLTFETKMLCKDGTLIPVEITTNFLDFEGQELVFAFVTDLSTRKKAEQENRQHREMLAHVARLSTMGELVAGIAHEVKQPLYAISNFATAASISLGSADPPQSLEKERLKELNECLTGIRESSERANEIIRGLREFARRGDQRRERININQIIRVAVDLVAFKARECHATVELQLADGLPDLVVDRIQCEQVVVNLLNNAYEAIVDQDAATVTIRTLQVAGDVELQIEDNGTGIPADMQGKLFEAFSTTKPHGMGMGLAISRTIVEAHRGELRGENNEAGGATFRVALPVPGEHLDTI